MTTIAFAGGGSGGHLFPGVAVAAELNRRDPAIRSVFVGSERNLEKKILQARRFEHFPLSAVPSSAFLRSPFASVANNWNAFRSSLRLLDSLRPEVVIGLGGFASVPLVVGAWRRQIPILLLEQNAVLGRANRFLLPFCQAVCLSFPNTPIPVRYRSKIRLTGNPVREEFYPPASLTIEQTKEPPTLLIMGGSQGATAVNRAVLDVFPRIQEELAGWRVIHQTGTQQQKVVSEEYERLGFPAEVISFIEDIQTIYRKAKLVVSRAGGTSLAEFAACGLPAVLIPHPHAIRDHQKRNAEYYTENGGAILTEQSSGLVDVLSRNLRFLLLDQRRCELMGKAMSTLARPQAAGDVVDLVLSLCREHSRGGTSVVPHQNVIN